MKWNPKPQLVTIEGDDDDTDEQYSFMGDDPYQVAELLGIECSDADLLTGTNQLTSGQIAYLNSKYPEYLGIWPIIAAAGKALIGAIPKGIKAIKKAVGKKKQKKADAKKADAEKKAALLAAAAAEKRRIELEKQEKAAAQKRIMIIGIPVAALFVMMMMKKK
ncbi:MAG: hypothetical protein PHE88_12340 [Elusimicrobia bacterium]|nr:hypothetical protein [Elusimicrobiota bacterium]